MPKRLGIVAVAIHGTCALELSMVEGVEGFEAEFHRGRFRESSHLVQSHIVVVDSRPIEETPRGSPKRAQRVRTEQRGVEGQRIFARIVIDIQWTQTWIVVRQIDADAVDPVVLDLDERIVSEALKGYRQSGRKAGHPGNRPALGQTVGHTEQLVKRQFVVVADDEVVLEVESRYGVFPTEIKRIDLLLDTGRPVYRLPIGVAGQ